MNKTIFNIIFVILIFISTVLFGIEIQLDDTPFEEYSDAHYVITLANNYFSPCIDTGDQNTEWDGDDTPPDMGRLRAVKHAYDNWEMPDINTDRGWKWMCFPVIDTVTNSQDYVGDMAEYMLYDILYPPIYLDYVVWKPLDPQGAGLEYIQYVEGD